MFGQVLDKLDAWFGRAFLFGAYFPSLLFALTNLALAYAFLPMAQPAIAAVWRDTAAGKTFDLVVALAAVAVFAFAAMPLTQIATNLMEGKRLPGWIACVPVMRESLRQERSARVQQRLITARSMLPNVDAVELRLGRARAAGARHRGVPDPKAIDAVQKLLDTLRLEFILRRPIEAGRLVAAEAALERALEGNCAELNQLGLPAPDGHVPYQPVTNREAERCRQLAELHG